MSFLALVTETTGIAPDPIRPFLIAGTAALLLFVFALVTWSYRDVANRHREKHLPGDTHDSHAGH